MIRLFGIRKKKISHPTPEERVMYTVQLDNQRFSGKLVYLGKSEATTRKGRYWVTYHVYGHDYESPCFENLVLIDPQDYSLDGGRITFRNRLFRRVRMMEINSVTNSCIVESIKQHLNTPLKIGV